MQQIARPSRQEGYKGSVESVGRDNSHHDMFAAHSATLLVHISIRSGQLPQITSMMLQMQLQMSPASALLPWSQHRPVQGRWPCLQSCSMSSRQSTFSGRQTLAAGRSATLRSYNNGSRAKLLIANAAAPWANKPPAR